MAGRNNTCVRAHAQHRSEVLGLMKLTKLIIRMHSPVAMRGNICVALRATAEASAAMPAVQATRFTYTSRCTYKQGVLLCRPRQGVLLQCCPRQGVSQFCPRQDVSQCCPRQGVLPLYGSGQFYKLFTRPNCAHTCGAGREGTHALPKGTA